MQRGNNHKASKPVHLMEHGECARTMFSLGKKLEMFSKLAYTELFIKICMCSVCYSINFLQKMTDLYFIFDEPKSICCSHVSIIRDSDKVQL